MPRRRSGANAAVRHEGMDVDTVLQRLGLDGPIRPDEAGLHAVHRAWVSRLPYENLDIQLGRPLSLTPGALLDKLVTRRRGGFCYELNAGLALLLRALGFDVTVIEAAVDLQVRDASAWRNHMPLLVTLDGQRWLADAGLMIGFLDPIPLRSGPHVESRLTYRLERVADATADTWRLFHQPHGGFTSMDFRCAPLSVDDFTAACAWRETDPESMFVRTLLVARSDVDRSVVLRARTLTDAGPAVPGGTQRRLLATADELATVLAEEFTVPLEDVDIPLLWQRAVAQHDAWLATQTAG